ncbi:MAG: molybdopterin-guanine dinucleotide biosynthesis protein B [Gemmatimonadetes bacterium]|nr:molybdopterin-guanine dinucleotide biosynthesis protein B [Gemmatimonadota bacterium]MYB97643.1 molybdopterin-guanine dinucleotide biosynthesis protein B [Gemmatimonadota bacterium]MYH51761.1 molybdopterin-guanine dinucleotide biosynthesis protein B [Gemmatimonadota bacterium]MYK67131.1 molybdopterin-guanine dinucleotide biosynthesis protein B [Gemmatimonadota bacterium]
MSLLGAVLAGGGSRRFGSPKTLARLHGTPLWKVVAGRLREVCDDVVAIVNHPGVARAVELETLPDRMRLMGPLGGIDAALDRAWRDGHAAVMVLAVDMPWVEVEALRRLANAWREKGRVSLAEMEEPWGFHPLCGVYPVKTVGPLAEALSRRRLEAGPFAGSLDPLVVDTGLPAASFRSVNRPADLPPPAVSVIGNKKSGKTTLAVNLIAELRGRGRRVMSAKHGHHFRLDTPGTDSWRHRHEGRAERVLLVGPDEFGLMGEWDPHGEQSLDLLLTRHLTDAEIVVAEGFRKAAIPKVEIYREEVQPEPVLDPEHARAAGAIAAVTDRPELPWSVPVFDPDDADTPARVADLAEAALL